MPKIIIPANSWRPRPYQMPAWAAWENGCKRSLLVWHRRAGKDELSLQKFAVASMLRPANYWHCLPKYEQARKAIWEAVNPHTGRKRIDEAFPAEIRKRTDNSSMVVEFKTGSVYRVVGSDNPNSLVGAPPLGIAFSEWAISNPSAWGLLQPILLENGGWADFITTPRGRNHVHGMLKMARARPDWFAQVLTVDDTHQVSLEQIADAKAEYVSLFGEDAAEALIQQEYWCSFEAAILGSYYGKELAQAEQQGRITDVEPTPNVPINVSQDLGVGDDNPLWFWQAVPGAAGRGQIKILDYYTAHGYGIKHYTDLIKRRIEQWDAEAKARNPDDKIELGIVYVPPDARVREQGSWNIDTLKAKQRIEVMAEQLDASHVKVVKVHSVQDGISAVRQVLHRCWFDETRCAAGLEALRQYQSEWDDKKKKFSDQPLHDWTSHPADAFRYLAMAYREIVPVMPAPLPGAIVVGTDAVPEGYRGATLEDLWRTAKPRRRRL